MNLFFRLFVPLLAAFGAVSAAEKPSWKAPKAVILFYADDLGYGDIGANGAKSIPTPNVDKLAREGLRFTDAHSTSSVCTPSRFGLLTGKYPWRQHGTGILPGDAAMIVPTADKAMTLASMMQAAGYRTAAIGKWHLGLGDGSGPIDWNGPISPGPKEVGFDESYIMAATADRVPCVFIRNGAVDKLDPADPIVVSYKENFPGMPTGKNNPELLRVKAVPGKGHDNTIINGIGRIGFMKGGRSALWTDTDLADTLTDEAVRFIAANRDNRFFLYFATNDIHVPRDPHARFIGKSQCGVRGDVTVQMDDCLGRIMKALKENGLDRDTLVIFTSDNGPVVNDGYLDGSEKDLGAHRPAGPWRGGKYTIHEGGTRMPMITWWPGSIKPGVSPALVSHVDFVASLARLVGVRIPAGSAPDSTDQLAALLGRDAKGRGELVEHKMDNKHLALRRGSYKYIPNQCLNAARGEMRASRAGSGVLIDLKADPGETTDISAKKPRVAEEMRKALQRCIDAAVK